MIRLATVGTSEICDVFLTGALKLDCYKLSAVYSRNADTAKAFAKKHDCNKIYTDLSQMAASPDIDAVYIATPNLFHFEQSRLFLENKKHVLCEKPIATSLNEYLDNKLLADKNGVIYMEAIMSRHHKEHSKIKECLNEIGQIRLARFDFNKRSSRLDYFLDGNAVNIFDMSLRAGALMDIGVYCVYAAVDFFGKPDSIMAESQLLYNGADGSGCAIFNYGGFLANLTYGKTGNGTLGSEIIGDKGVLKIPSVSQYTGVTLVKNGKEYPISDITEKSKIMSYEADCFAEFILNSHNIKEKYSSISRLCADDHSCMDEIKIKSRLKYK